MNRVERYRQYRKTKLKITVSFIVFFILITAGIFVADYSINCIMRNENKVEIISIRSVNDASIQINLMNKRLYINTRYIKRDYNRLREFVRKAI